MKILVTNDDGLGAPGLKLLQKVAQSFGSVWTVAPDSEKSGISHRITFERPLQIRQFSDHVLSVDGTPADCVRVATARFGVEFDFVISGVNNGANLGVETYYSGTVAAAREASFLGIPAVAISQYRKRYADPFDWSRPECLVRNLIQQSIESELSPGQCYNINIPDNYESENNGSIESVFCEPDPSPLPSVYTDTGDEMELSFSYSNRPQIPGCDVANCFGGKVTISRLSFVGTAPY